MEHRGQAFPVLGFDRVPHGKHRNGPSEALVSALGSAYNALGIYFFIRFLTRDSKEAVEHIRFLALASIILAILMIPELRTGRNFFSVLGGVNPISEFRDGRVRCQGPSVYPSWPAPSPPRFSHLWSVCGFNAARTGRVQLSED